MLLDTVAQGYAVKKRERERETAYAWKECGRETREREKRGEIGTRQRKMQYRGRNVKPKADRVDAQNCRTKPREPFTENEESDNITSTV